MAGAAGGFHPHLPPRSYTFAGKALGAVMWFFIFYRFRKDYSSKLLGRHSFMDGEHGHGNGHDEHH